MRYIRSYAALLVVAVAFVAPLRPWRMAKWLRRDGLAWRVALVIHPGWAEKLKIVGVPLQRKGGSYEYGRTGNGNRG